MLKAPSDHSPDEDTPRRTDDASGLHSKGGTTARGSKFVLIETISDAYRGRYIVAAAHVTPKAGKQQGDEAAPTVTALLNLTQDAPGMWGNICDTVLRGSHIKMLARAGIVTVNIPPAQENPDRKTKGRNSDKRVERTQYLRTHRHNLPNGHVCEHRLHTVGSVPHQEAYDDEGNLVLIPLPNGFAGKAPQNADGSYRWYVAYQVPCPNAETSAWLRIDGPGHADTKGWAWTDVMRLYPVGTPQYGLLYRRRNATESLHRQYKRKARTGTRLRVHPAVAVRLRLHRHPQRRRPRIPPAPRRETKRPRRPTQNIETRISSSPQRQTARGLTGLPQHRKPQSPGPSLPREDGQTRQETPCDSRHSPHECPRYDVPRSATNFSPDNRRVPAPIAQLAELRTFNP